MAPELESGSGGTTTVSEGSFRQWLRFWLDVAVRLTVPLGAIAGIWLAHSFDMQQSVRQIANQREQSESNLRAMMFGNLLTPIVGPQKDVVDPVRYALMVQLLALNFHEHFEFRPLMEHADQLLAESRLPDKAERRWALKGIAHRVIDRQIASLSEDSVVDCESKGPAQVTFWFLSPDQDKALIQSYRAQYGLDHVVLFRPEQRRPIVVNSPNCKDTLEITFFEPKWSLGRVDVNILRTSPDDQQGTRRWSWLRPWRPRKRPASANTGPDAFQFTLSSFSFPFTDNTPLIDGNRFALFIRDESSGRDDGNGQFIWKVQLRWFPEQYYAVTERPINYGVVRDALNIVPHEGVRQ